MLDKPKYTVSHEDRYLVCLEEVEGPIKVLINHPSPTPEVSGFALAGAGIENWSTGLVH